MSETLTRLAYETPTAYWRKVHTKDDRIAYLRIGKDNGLARWKLQTSYAAGSTHKIAPEDRELDRHTFNFKQLDNTDKYSSYTDAIQVGYHIHTGISYLDTKEFAWLSLTQVHEFIEERYRDLHTFRDYYQGVFWNMNYDVIYEDTVQNFNWNSGMYASYEDISFWLEGRDGLYSLWDNLAEASAGYQDVIIHSIAVKFRHDHMEL